VFSNFVPLKKQKPPQNGSLAYSNFNLNSYDKVMVQNGKNQQRMLGIGSEFPSFEKKAVVSLEKGKEFYTISSEDHKKAGKWMVMFWWPKDFTFVCPTEIAEFNKNAHEFADRDAVLLGASTDSEFVHLAWRNNHDDLRNLRFPMIADTSKSLAEELGILEANEKIAYRVTYIIDPQGVIRWVASYDLNVGRNVPEVLRVLDALQTDELCPCNWKKGEETLVVA
jgi:peroxiredoxin (alkyl hydroperoxide reductase subunit C)